MFLFQINKLQVMKISYKEFTICKMWTGIYRINALSSQFTQFTTRFWKTIYFSYQIEKEHFFWSLKERDLLKEVHNLQVVNWSHKYHSIQFTVHPVHNKILKNNLFLISNWEREFFWSLTKSSHLASCEPWTWFRKI